jgi:hypothetical protein
VEWWKRVAFAIVSRELVDDQNLAPTIRPTVSLCCIIVQRARNLEAGATKKFLVHLSMKDEGC